MQLLGRTRIGTGCRIRSFSVIENCTLGDGVLIRQSCVLEDSTIADGAQIGPFAHLRPGNEIGENAHVGNFVEMKKARLGKGAKANHLTYLGDAEIGEGANIGAGTITCNYDGVNKHITRIGKGVFVGSDSTLVAPVTVGDGAYIGAGSCITKDVPADALAVSRAQQATKEGWAAARRAKRQSKSSMTFRRGSPNRRLRTPAGSGQCHRSPHTALTGSITARIRCLIAKALRIRSENATLGPRKDSTAPPSLGGGRVARCPSFSAVMALFVDKRTP